MPPSNRTSIEAELTVVADAIDRYGERVASLAFSSAGGTGGARSTTDADDADLVSAIHEAERALRSAHRHLLRAIKLSR